jgi:predicted MFS family arabinose efflux permease
MIRWVNSWVPRWRVAAFLGLAAALNYADRGEFSAVLQPLRDELALTAMSIVSMGVSVGVVAGGAVAGHFAELFGWRYGFWILGGVGILVALTAGSLVSEPLWRDSGEAPLRRATVSRSHRRNSDRFAIPTRRRATWLNSVIVIGVAGKRGRSC